MARLRPVKRRKLAESEDFIVDKNRIRLAQANVFKRDPVNLIRIFYLAQKHNLAFHPDAMRAITRSLKLIDAKLRENEEANELFVDILTSKNDPETVLRRMNEAGVLGHFVPAFGKIVAMMQFNMYHHYTVDEHLLRCIGVLAEIDRGSNSETPLANELMHKILPEHRRVIYVTMFLHDIAKGRPEDHSIAGARVARRFARGSVFQRPKPKPPPGSSKIIWSCRASHSRATCPTARPSRISPPLFSQPNGSNC